MKMSDVFELPLCVPIGTDAELTDDYCNHIAEFQFIKHAKAASHAINNYDRLVSFLSELINSEDITFFESAIESGGPSYMNLQEWSDKARGLLGKLGENK